MSVGETGDAGKPGTLVMGYGRADEDSIRAGRGKFMIVSLRQADQTQFVNSLIVSENYFAVLKPQFGPGRLFEPRRITRAGSSSRDWVTGLQISISVEGDDRKN
ncbi:MAG: hypothetical protein EHM23_13380 [Acidobacteria bacterium]|nr:MAG: hypothetical protein EHM23_13380 [Acidobacteriota bacterium]